MDNEKQIKSIWKLIILHLVPGIVLTIIYIFMVKSGFLGGYPKIVILGFAVLVSIVPTELGYLFYIAYKEKGGYNIFEILGLKSKLKIKEYILYTLSLFILTGILITVMKPLSNLMLNTIFSWLPEWYIYIENMNQFNRPYIITAILVGFFFITLIGPITEELYFRGFLLARMKWMGNYGVLLNVVLFSIYHFWSPWLIIARIVAFLPLFYYVQKKNSLKLAISVHCLANFTDVISLMALL